MRKVDFRMVSIQWPLVCMPVSQEACGGFRGTKAWKVFYDLRRIRKSLPQSGTRDQANWCLFLISQDTDHFLRVSMDTCFLAGIIKMIDS